jgi:putative oxidoreductase
VPQEIDTMIDTRTAPYGATVLRVGLGVLALTHGLTKLFVFGPAGTVGFFQSLGYPAIAAYYAMAFETLGGLALILGFYPRVAALLQLPILLGATLVHLPNGWMFTSPNGGFEFPLFWAAALLAQVLLGPGALALRDVGPLNTSTATARTA